MLDDTREILDVAETLGYECSVSWRTQPTRKAHRIAKGPIGVGWLDGTEFEAAMLFDPEDEDRELVAMLQSHGVTVYDANGDELKGG